MPQSILCLDEEVCHFAERFRTVFSKPQYQYFVTVLLGLMECEGKRTLSGVLSKVGEPPSLSGLSRFFSEAPWVQEALVVIWLEHFRAEMQPLVETECEQQRQHQPKRSGGRAAALAPLVATPSEHWGSSARDPAPSSSWLAYMAPRPVPFWRSP